MASAFARHAFAEKESMVTEVLRIHGAVETCRSGKQGSAGSKGMAFLQRGV